MRSSDGSCFDGLTASPHKFDKAIVVTGLSHNLLLPGFGLDVYQKWRNGLQAFSYV